MVVSTNEAIPFAADDVNILAAELLDEIVPRYYVIGRALCGGRFYSENVKDYDEAMILFDKYSAVVDYFGGGIVELHFLYLGEDSIMKDDVLL